jgi:hypothetical protein
MRSGGESRCYGFITLNCTGNLNKIWLNTFEGLLSREEARNSEVYPNYSGFFGILRRATFRWKEIGQKSNWNNLLVEISCKEHRTETLPGE